ncbi:MAG TPA: hypothetical protein VNE71_17100 [Myxococcota bacterium]|nr:hypothetical protein [Myxococcota bacterium]
MFFQLFGPEFRIVEARYDAAGALIAVGGSTEPISHSSAGAFRTFVLPGGARVTDGHGEVFDSQTLGWRDSLLGEVDDLAFDGATPIRVHYSTLTRYTAELEPVGTHELSEHPDAVFARDGTVFAFSNTFAEPPEAVANVEAVPVAAIDADPLEEPPAEPPSMRLPPYVLGIDGAGTISYFPFEGLVPALYRWSVPAGQHVAPIPLRTLAYPSAHCPALGGLLFGYGDGALRLIPDGAAEDRHWHNVWGDAKALACTGEQVVALTARRGTVGGSLTTYTPAGEIVDSIAIDPIPFTPQAAWSEAHGRLYVRNDYPPALGLSSYPIDAHGAIGPAMVSPNSAAAGAIRGADGPFLVSGGYLYDAETLERGETVGTDRGAIWHEGRLYVLRQDGEADIAVWEASGERAETAPLPNAFALFEHAGTVLAAFLENRRLIVRAVAVEDLDGDGVPIGEDAFPGDPDEWSDRDGDGSGDHGDVFPDDPAESKDRDGDGVGDNADRFDDDPTEWSDRDRDGRGDNSDAFPDDRSEWRDTDGDGHGDNADRFDNDPAEWADSDGDGSGDNGDEFPLDPTESRDYDDDGIGDHSDPFPIGEPAIGLVEFTGRERAIFSRLGAVSRKLPVSNLGLLADGIFSLCDPSGGCMFGVHRPADTRGRRFELEIDPDFITAVEPGLEQALADALSRGFRRTVTLDLVLRPEDGRALVKLEPGKKHGVFKVKWIFDAHLGNVPGPYQRLRFALVWKFHRAQVVRP